jgi:hypothetical protein
MILVSYGIRSIGYRDLLVSRADVAHLMLRVLQQPETIKQAIGIAN